MLAAVASACVLCAVTPFVLTLLNLAEYKPPPKLDGSVTDLQLTVIIPARNEESGIAAGIAAVQQSSGVDLQVIVVDDGASPPIAPRLEPFESRLSLRSLRLERHGPAAARV